MGPNESILIPALLLVLVASLPSSSGLRFRWAALAYLLFLASAVALLWQAIDRSSLWAGTFESSVRKYAVVELNEASERNVIVIDGGSYVLNGVDTDFLEDELKTLGYSVRSVRLAAGGANHFERYTLNQEVVAGFMKRDRRGQRWTYLAEVHNSYDCRPLAQFEDHQDTVRVLHYMTPRNAWYAVRALRSPNVEIPLAGEWKWPVFRHALVNAFNVGVASRLTPEADIELSSGHVSTTRQVYSRFRGLAPLLANATATPPVDPLGLPWLRDIRERRLAKLWKPYIQELVYFGLPSTKLDQLRHVRSFCAATPHKCIAPDDPQLIERLDSKKHWRNAGHLRASGAEIYSRWLAHELDRLGVLQK